MKNITKIRGFTLVETMVSLAVFSLILVAVVGSFLAMNASNSTTTSSRELSEGSQRALEGIIFEIKSAKSIYTPTTTASQLSLETIRYLPAGQTNTFIDFFLCGSAICLKKEGVDAIAITPETIQITNLAFTQITTNSMPSVKVDITASRNQSSINLSSVASLRSY